MSDHCAVELAYLYVITELLLLLLFITFMQGADNYMPETTVLLGYTVLQLEVMILTMYE